jgi:hypothetical protein
VSQIVRLDSEIRIIDAKLAQFEMKAGNKQRLVSKKTNSGVLLQEEKYVRATRSEHKERERESSGSGAPTTRLQRTLGGAGRRSGRARERPDSNDAGRSGGAGELANDRLQQHGPGRRSERTRKRSPSLLLALPTQIPP